MLPIDLSGRIAVVTGASGQLGRVMARTLAQCGADIAVHYHQNRDEIEAASVQALRDDIHEHSRLSRRVVETTR